MTPDQLIERLRGLVTAGRQAQDAVDNTIRALKRPKPEAGMLDYARGLIDGTEKANDEAAAASILAMLEALEPAHRLRVLARVMLQLKAPRISRVSLEALSLEADRAQRRHRP